MSDVQRVTVQAEPTGPTAPAPSVGDRPAFVPEKFWDAKTGIKTEDLAKAYVELEKMKSGGQPQSQPQTTPQGQPNADAPVAVPGVSPEQMQAFTKEVSESGKLSDASYEALAKAGYPRAVVDQYVSSITHQQQSAAKEIIASVHQAVGGVDKYTAITDWAANGGLTDAEIHAFNQTMATNDKNAISLAVAGLQAKYHQANGTEGKFVDGSGDGGLVNSGPAFQSTHELTKAMQDPRYKQDPAYRAEVASRLKRSKIV